MKNTIGPTGRKERGRKETAAFGSPFTRTLVFSAIALLFFSFFGPSQLQAQSDETESLSVSVDNLSFAEADGSRGTADFNVTLSETRSYSIYVSYHTVDGSAKAGEDYVAVTGNVQIPPGETSAVVSVPVIDDSEDEAVETFSLSASIAMKSSDISPASATGECSILDNDADTVVLIQDGRSDPIPGEEYEYDIIIQNNGNHTISGAQVSDAAPADLVNLRWSCLPSPGAICSMGLQLGPLSDLPQLPPGGAVSYVLLGTVEAHTTGSLSYEVQYDLRPSGYQPTDPSNTAARSEHTVQPLTDFGLNITDSADPLPEDGHISYTLAVTNHGPSASSGGRIVNQLPPGLHFESSADGCYLTMDGIVCPFPALDPGASIAPVFTVSATEEPGVIVTDSATVQSNETDPSPDNNIANEETSLDHTPPQIIGVTNEPGGTTVDSCHGLRETSQAIKIEFSEALENLAGTDQPGDADCPDSYLLLYSGANRNFETSGCTNPGGDDVRIEISGVKINQNQITLTPANTPLQQSGLYRLVACGNLEDPAHNPIDGDGNGQGGDDFQLDFRYSPADILPNEHFDCSLEGWDIDSTIPEEIEYSPDDALGSELSGSAFLQTISSAPGEKLGLSQCLPIEEGSTIKADASFILDSSNEVQVRFSCIFFPTEGCSYESLRSDSSLQSHGSTSGAWTRLANFSSLPAPQTALSARCGFDLSSPSGEDFSASIDEIDLRVEVSSSIFLDGFESGTTNSWSAEVYE